VPTKNANLLSQFPSLVLRFIITHSPYFLGGSLLTTGFMTYPQLKLAVALSALILNEQVLCHSYSDGKQKSFMSQVLKIYCLACSKKTFYLIKSEYQIV